MCSTLYIFFLLLVIFWEAPFKAVSGELLRPKVFAKGDKIYRFPDHSVTYDEAERFCEEDGGRLAIITKSMVSNDNRDPFYLFMSQYSYGFWIGMSDRDEEGSWMWNNGQTVTSESVDWGYRSPFVLWTESFWSDCGRLYRESYIWEWRWWQEKCGMTLPSLCEYEEGNFDLCQYECKNTRPLNTGIDSSNPSLYVYKGKIYNVPDHETDFSNAEKFCGQDGGRLGIITLSQVDNDNSKAPLTPYFYSHVGKNCMWVGMSDRESEGNWVWNTGEPVYLVQWASNNWLTSWGRSGSQDCGRMCFNGKEWLWKETKCDDSLRFVCEYEDPKTEECLATCKATGDLPKPTSTVQPRRRSKTKPVKAKRTVVIKTHESTLLIGEPMFTISVYTVTMCSRACIKRENCSVLNYNKVTKKCVAYSSNASIAYEEHPHWEVWTVTYMNN